VEEIDQRVEVDREIARPVRRAKLSALLPLVATNVTATLEMEATIPKGTPITW
jgi:hypothetical protein